MKKIMFLMSTNGYSGAENVNLTIIDKLSDKYEFAYASTAGNISKYLDNKNVKHIIMKNNSIKEIRRVIKEYKPDIIHATDYRASIKAVLARNKVPIISHLHNNSPWIRKICLYSILFLIFSKKMKKILTVSNSIEKEYIFSKFIKNKIECVGNPVERKKILDRVENNIKKEYDICCVARITKSKKPKRFINIIENLKKDIPTIKCIWIGNGELYQEVLEYAKEKNVLENIEFIGFKDNPYKYMKKSKIFVLTSEWEGFGLVAFEALTLGIPCVVSNVGGLVEIVDDTCGKLCSNNDDFINELRKLLLNNDYYNTKCEGAIKKSVELENIEEYIIAIDKIYKEII